MIPRAFWQYFAAFTFAVETVCGALWWIAWFEPRLRPQFQSVQTSNAALFAFFVADTVVFVGTGVWSALRLVCNPAKARFPLALHLGASLGAALGCIAQTLLTGKLPGAAIATTFCVSCGLLLGRKAVGRN